MLELENGAESAAEETLEETGKEAAEERVEEGAPEGPPPAGLAEDQFRQLMAAIGTLGEQFSGKIAADAHKNALFDRMYQELTGYRSGALDKLVETMALDIIQLVDSTNRSLRSYAEKEPTEDNYERLLGILRATAEDLNGILYRQGIEPYQVEGDTVDVRRQKIVRTVETHERARENLVARRLAEGYEKEGRVLRPERIMIYKYRPEAPGGDGEA